MKFRESLIERPELLAQVSAQVAQLRAAPIQRRAAQILADLALVRPEVAVPPEEWSASARARANIAAIEILARAEGRPLSTEERMMVLRYSGWGGVGIEKYAGQIPEGWAPEERGLIHEYYTPSGVAAAVAGAIKPLLPSLLSDEDRILALEPSAGIGRFINAMTGPGFERLAWRAVEYSTISGRLLAAVRPDIQVAVGVPFERWVSENEMGIGGRLRLLVSNPPYGQRGASVTEDPDKTYRKGVLGQRAYAYFLARGLDLLDAGGLGVYLIPYGFLTGSGVPMVALRERILRRHHLSGAFRLPSTIFPGANLVTDLLFFRARGGELPQVVEEDKAILEGRYFEDNPLHILGTEVGKKGDEDDTTRKPRWGYEVRGTFTGLPGLVERPICRDCAAASFRKAVSRKVKKAEPQLADLPEAVQAAVKLGDRVSDFLRARAAGQTGDLDQAQRAAALYKELRKALLVFQKKHGGVGQDEELSRYAAMPEIVSLRAAFAGDGLAPAFAAVPEHKPRYLAGPEDVGAQAEYLYQTLGRVTLFELMAFHKQVGGDVHEPQDFAHRLYGALWCRDGDFWLPERDYYTGSLWDKYDRAKAAAGEGDPSVAGQASLQAARLLQAIKPASFDEMHIEPRTLWNMEVMQAWLAAWIGAEVPPLVREGGIIKPEGGSYTEFAEKGAMGQVRLGIALGYLNHDFSLFRIPSYLHIEGNIHWGCNKKQREDGVEESAEEAQARCRIEYGQLATTHFQEFVRRQPDLRTQLENEYNRMVRGFVLPTYGQDDLKIGRWRGSFTLRPHQRAGARRLLVNKRGLLAFDVGVGKTLTGIATIAKAREEGWAERPVVVVPNTIVWKWYKDLTRALPDYRVLVIGSRRFTLSRGPRRGHLTSEIDTPEERALKWRAFQAGEYDVALVTYSVLGRNSLRAESVRTWLQTSSAVLRELSLKARNLLADAEKGKKGGKVLEKRDEKRREVLRLVENIADMSERERAVQHEVLDRWVAERIEHTEKPDPGIYWEDLGVDLILVDEAQNFKNLFSIGEREGGMPKYLGAIQEGSNRAWDLAIRSAMVRKRTGGGGVMLLSATPAKNSPVEYYSLLSFVDEDAWGRLGIFDAEMFVDRFLRLELKRVLDNDGSWKTRSIVAGFQNLGELRDHVFRYAEFRTAQEVGLKLPAVERHDRLITMSDRQAEKYQAYVVKLMDLRKTAARDPAAKYAMLGTLQKMALVSVHPLLDEGNWTWQNAGEVDPELMHAPKLDAVAEVVAGRPECGHIIFCDNVAVHRWMTEVLVRAGVARERIAIINADQAKGPAERQAIAENFNGEPKINADGQIVDWLVSPKYDVVIANATAYEGIDLQVRTCSVHHLDLPWDPATLQQRNGRAVRQGNKQAVIAIYYYLSRSSFDANRLQMITGKLAWMKDILETADRETSNPAAGSDLTADEMIMMVSTDKESALRLIEEQKQREEEERRAKIGQQGWAALRLIVSKLDSIGREADEMMRAQRGREVDELYAYLTSLDVDTWPWLFVAQMVREGRQVVIRHKPEMIVIWDGLRLDGAAQMGETRAHEFSVRDGDVSWRREGALTWEKVDWVRFTLMLGTIAATQKANNAAVFQGIWPEEKDREGWISQAQELLDRLAADRWVSADTLGVQDAPWRWRRVLWDEIGVGLVDALRIRNRTEDGLFVPVRDGEGLKLLKGKDLDGREAIPFTEEGFSEYLGRVPAALKVNKYGWRELNAASMNWFGERTPMGLGEEKE